MRRRADELWFGKVEQHRARFRYRVGIGATTTERRVFDTREEAERHRAAALKAQEQQAPLTLEDVLVRYRAHKIDVRRNGPVSADTEIHRLIHFFGRSTGPLPQLTASAANALYRRSQEGRSVAYATASLKAARRLGKWLVRERLWRANPLLEVEIVGRSKRGEESKRQLSRDQGRMWLAGALACYEEGDVGALAAAVLITMGVRASEIASRRVSHLDDDGCLLRIPYGKSKSALRDLPVPYPTANDPGVPDLRSALLAQARAARAWGRAQKIAQIDPPLFPPVPYAAKGNPVKGEHLSRYSVRRAVHRVCRATGLPDVCPHALRGTFASRAVALGVAIREVARDLGQAGPGVTERHYVGDQAMAEGAQRARALALRSTAPALPQASEMEANEG